MGLESFVLYAARYITDEVDFTLQPLWSPRRGLDTNVIGWVSLDDGVTVHCFANPISLSIQLRFQKVLELYP